MTFKLGILFVKDISPAGISLEQIQHFLVFNSKRRHNPSPTTNHAFAIGHVRIPNCLELIEHFLESDVGIIIGMQIDEDRNRWGSSLAVAILDQINLVLGCVLAAACIYSSNERNENMGKRVEVFRNNANSDIH